MGGIERMKENEGEKEVGKKGDRERDKGGEKERGRGKGRKIGIYILREWGGRLNYFVCASLGLGLSLLERNKEGPKYH